MAKVAGSIRDRWRALSLIGKIYLVLTLVLSLVIAITAICYIVGCISIYTAGNDPMYSREIVNEKLAELAPISIICIILVIAAGVLSLFVDAPKRKAIPLRKSVLLRLTEKRLAGHTLSEEFVSSRKREEKYRKIIFYIALGTVIAVAAVALIFILDPSRYTSDDINLDIAYSVVIGAVATFISFAACFAASMLLDRSYVREQESAKAEILRIKESGEAAIIDEPECPHGEGHMTLIIRFTILIVSIVFIILGIFNGGMADVLGKAVRICTECIGLG
ncbi:MAG: hypothetical protein IKC87_01740 [Clostridia bacterium]|nr:hypothetical protein [Clostridia bacterium]